MAKKILFVEDEASLQRAIGESLKKVGYEVLSATDGQQAMEQIKSQDFDLIVLDIVLPKVDGFEVLKKIKSDPEKKDIPVLVLTNLETSGDVQKALELGATNYLVKANYSLEQMIEKINSMLQ
ncbi:MAG TPA: response regulator [Candidatus Pacearchaeota archaeon]|jgi:CheY-like chemotaxis protein|nr:response regulator [Candidatus Parcubacteria bacterium]HOU45695.1 response regulator [Candidatus Pacearchaeota archaeon]HPM08490.1 response regulator [Candidatus Pacearchaeota archaeon]HQI74811.1 response regulator [Candidatus Pacearchaeota archaeon]